MRAILLIVILAWPRPGSSAAEAGQPGAYLRAGVGARAAALADAAAALTEGPDAAYWNPAALALARRPALASSLSVLSLGRQYNSAGLLLAWDREPEDMVGFPMSQRSGLGAWGLTWLSFSLGDDFEGRRSDTASFYKFSDRQSAYVLSHGRPIFSWLSLGAGLKRYDRVLETFSAEGHGADLGALLLLGPQVKLGVSASDLMARLRWSTGYEESLPVVLRNSLSARLWKRVSVAGQLMAVEGRAWQPQIGLEAEALKGVFLRTGWKSEGLSAGAGLRLPLQSFSLQLDYAYLPDPLKESDTQRIDLSIYF